MTKAGGSRFITVEWMQIREILIEWVDPDEVGVGGRPADGKIAVEESAKDLYRKTGL